MALSGAELFFADDVGHGLEFVPAQPVEPQQILPKQKEEKRQTGHLMDGKRPASIDLGTHDLHRMMMMCLVLDRWHKCVGIGGKRLEYVWCLRSCLQQ